MTEFITNGILLIALSSMAHADISDSGALTIGQQAVIAGTMTVQGNAFSVGGSTFQVAGGSITLGGRLNTATAGIKWADGTVQISSPPAVTASSIGAAVLSATQTFSGANIFTSSVIINGSFFINPNDISSQTIFTASLSGTTLPTCVVGSTLAITVPVTTVFHISLHGGGIRSFAGTISDITFLMNGVRVYDRGAPAGTGKASWRYITGGTSTGEVTPYIDIFSTPQNAGTYNFCFASNASVACNEISCVWRISTW